MSHNYAQIRKPLADADHEEAHAESEFDSDIDESIVIIDEIDQEWP